jgi:hypothetical protein
LAALSAAESVAYEQQGNYLLKLLREAK